VCHWTPVISGRFGWQLPAHALRTLFPLLQGWDASPRSRCEDFMAVDPRADPVQMSTTPRQMCVMGMPIAIDALGASAAPLHNQFTVKVMGRVHFTPLESVPTSINSPGGFLAAEFVRRSRALGAAFNTPFNSLTMRRVAKHHVGVFWFWTSSLESHYWPPAGSTVLFSRPTPLTPLRILLPNLRSSRASVTTKSLACPFASVIVYSLARKPRRRFLVPTAQPYRLRHWRITLPPTVAA